MTGSWPLRWASSTSLIWLFGPCARSAKMRRAARPWPTALERSCQTPAGELMPMSGVPARTTARMLLRCGRLLRAAAAASLGRRRPEPAIEETPRAEAPAAAPPKRRRALRRERFSMGPIPIEGAERQPGRLGSIRCTRPAGGIRQAAKRAGPGRSDAMPPGYAWTSGPNARESRSGMTWFPFRGRFVGVRPKVECGVVGACAPGVWGGDHVKAFTFHRLLPHPIDLQTGNLRELPDCDFTPGPRR